MRIIDINPLTIKRIKIMAKSLIPWVGYVKVTYSGLVTLKTNWWSLRKTRISVTDLCLLELPKRIANSADRHGLTKNYFLMFKEQIATYLELQFTNSNSDVLEYVWDVYTRYHMDVPIIEKIPDLSVPLAKSNIQTNVLPILSITSYNSRYGVHKIFKDFRKYTIKKHKNKLVKKIQRIQNNLPMRLYQISCIFG